MSKIRQPVEIKIISKILHKKCTFCNKWFILSADNFYRNNRSKVGFTSFCKECQNYSYLNKDTKQLFQGQNSKVDSWKHGPTYWEIRERKASSEVTSIPIEQYYKEKQIKNQKLQEIKNKKKKQPENYVIWMKEYRAKKRKIWNHGE